MEYDGIIWHNRFDGKKHAKRPSSKNTNEHNQTCDVTTIHHDSRHDPNHKTLVETSEDAPAPLIPPAAHCARRAARAALRLQGFGHEGRAAGHPSHEAVENVVSWPRSSLPEARLEGLERMRCFDPDEGVWWSGVCGGPVSGSFPVETGHRKSRMVNVLRKLH